MRTKNLWKSMLCLMILFFAPDLNANEIIGNYTDFDLKIKETASECRREVIHQFKRLITTKQLSTAQLFDTFYIPIQNTQPQKFNTAYDSVTDGVLRPILDKYVEVDPKIVFVVAVDRNGYIPTHNSKFSKPLTDDPIYNAKNNRAKCIYNDRTGLAAARNQKSFLVQRYTRDTGEKMYDLSVPIILDGKHWGAIRVGYRQMQ